MNQDPRTPWTGRRVFTTGAVVVALAAAVFTLSQLSQSDTTDTTSPPPIPSLGGR
ncbi:hypothetical protein [Sinosporangium album]|uniref:hypothetical protein n=1 Tax=Sinosporangium album TaxID=504805 RepID=UPI0015A18BC4|nr:hypothetical protein [Sinosporangium album]